MELSGQHRDWQDLAELDPCWAILTEPDKKFRRWDLDQFFLSGKKEIETVMLKAEALHLPRRRTQALDFGCGVGRLTRALAIYFEKVYGVDISETMISKAQELNSSYSTCKFLVNTTPTLCIFQDGAFDMVYTGRVLQHMAPRGLVVSYISEFLRILADGGLLVLQIPTHIPFRHMIQPRRRLFNILRNLGFRRNILYNRLGLDPIRMAAVPEKQVLKALQIYGARILDSQGDQLCGPEIRSRTYYVTK